MPESTMTFCVSDLHACDCGPRDNFSYDGREEQFGKFLDMVEKQQGRLLIRGDLLDWWQVPVGAAITAHRPLLDRLAAMGARWVIGNHDNALSALIGTPLMIDHPLFRQSCHPFEETIGGRQFAFLHGHEADPYCCEGLLAVALADMERAQAAATAALDRVFKKLHATRVEQRVWNKLTPASDTAS